MNYEIKDKMCITPCPYGVKITKVGPGHQNMLGKVRKVGSIACRFGCEHYTESNRLMGNWEKNTIICKLEKAMELSSLAKV